MKPDLTFRRSLRLILQRWWLVLLCGIGVAALAFGLTGFQKGHYTATTKLTVNDYTVTTDITGNPTPLATNPKFGDSWVPQDFISNSAADAAVKQVGSSCLSSSGLIGGLTATGLTQSTVQLDLTGCSSQSATKALLAAYAKNFLDQRSAQEVTQFQDANTAIVQGTYSIPDAATRKNVQRALSKEEQYLHDATTNGFGSAFGYTSPFTTFAKASGPKGIIASVGGLLAGFAVGALIALAIGRLDRYVRRPDDIEVAGVPVVDVDSELDQASVQLLRSELELAGVGTKLAVIAVARANREEGSSGLALALARAFAGVGTPTTIVSADLRASRVRTEPGLSGLLSGSQTTAPLVRLDPSLDWLPEGDSNSLPETLFSAPRVERVLRDLREHSAVIVIDAPAVLEDSETLPLVACSDVVLLTVRPGRTRWSSIGSAVGLIQRIAQRPMHICYDRAGEMTSVPAAGEQRTAAADRVQRAIEVPAGP